MTSYLNSCYQRNTKPQLSLLFSGLLLLALGLTRNSMAWTATDTPGGQGDSVHQPLGQGIRPNNHLHGLSAIGLPPTVLPHPFRHPALDAGSILKRKASFEMICFGLN